MPVSRQTAEALAREVAALYAEAERLMLERIARNLAAGIDGPAWAEKKLAQMAANRQQMQQLLRDLNARALTGAETALTQAYAKGGLAALTDMGLGVNAPIAGAKAIEMMTAELVANLSSMNVRILRTMDDLYQRVIAESTTQVLTGAQTRKQAAQAALDSFARKGIVGFTDAAGRGWNMESYAEMAVRSGVTRASVAGHMDTLQANGLDLVIVSADGSPCSICQPFEGRVFSISGKSNEYPPFSEAENSGLFHPNCRHTASAYQEGITRPYPTKTAAEREAEAQRYQDEQRLRSLERNVRQAKREQAVAITPDAQRAATQKVKEAQADIRAHVAATDVTRQSAREQIGHAH